MIKDLLARNARFVAHEFQPNDDYYRSIADRIARERGLSREEKLAVLTEENVKLQIKHLRNLALIRNMHARGPLPRIHGWLYRVETGTIDVLVDGGAALPA